jgi:hypothetical protein
MSTAGSRTASPSAHGSVCGTGLPVDRDAPYDAVGQESCGVENVLASWSGSLIYQGAASLLATVSAAALLLVRPLVWETRDSYAPCGVVQ